LPYAFLVSAPHQIKHVKKECEHGNHAAALFDSVSDIAAQRGQSLVEILAEDNNDEEY